MTQAGNTTQTMKPKDPVYTHDILKDYPLSTDKVQPETITGTDTFTVCPDVNTLSDILAEIPYVNEEANLRGRVIDLESRVSVLEDRIARHNVNSAWKIPG